MRRYVPTALFVLGVLFLAWLFYPPQPAEVGAALRFGQKQFQAQLEAAADPARNGYLSPEWQPLWAPREGSSQPSKLVFLAKATGALSPETFPDLKRLQQLIRDKDPQVISTLQSFAAVVEGLQREWVKEAFVPLYKRPSLLQPLPNMSVLGELSKACSALAYERLLSGRADDAVRLGIPSLRLSTTLIRNGSVTWLAAGLSLRRLPLASFLRVLQSRQPLNNELLAALVREVANNQLAPDELQLALAGELLGAEEFFRPSPGARMEMQNALEKRELGWLRVPGVLQRDRRIFHRQFAPLLRVSDDYGLAANQAIRQSEGSWIRGERSIVGRLILPHTYQPALQVEIARHELACVHALLAIRLYEQQHGQLPAKLDGLTPAALPGFDWSESVWNYEPVRKRLLLRLPAALLQVIGKARLYREGDVQGGLHAEGLAYPL